MNNILTIQKIQIYGFGKHENITISLHEGVTIFYGMNEAGKTTIQQFILQVLFGFPTKQQTQRKYEPKISTKFGGQLTILHPTYGQCTIERVKGKAVGDVTVYLEDGTTGHEELLAKLLYGYSRASFESIFSFSLHELQGIEKMSEEELTHLLLASGTTGIQQLSSLEKKLDKDASELFKKSGKVPLINQKLEHLKKLERTIKQEQGNIQTFEDKLLQLQQLDQRLEGLYNQQKKQQQNWQQLTILKQAMPLLKQQKAFEQTLKSYGHVQFPPEGIRRYEQLKDRLMHETLQMEQLKEQYQALQNKLQLTVDEQTITEMARLLNKEATWNQVVVKEQNLMDELYLLEQEIEAQFRLLGVQEKTAQDILLEETVSLQQEEQFQRQLSLLEEAEEELKFHLRSLEQIHAELDTIAQQKQQLKQESLSTEEEHILAQWPQRKRKLDQLRYGRSQRSKQQQPSVFIFIVLAISVLSFIYGVFEKNVAVIVIGAVMSLFIILYLKFARQAHEAPSKQSSQEIRELEQEENIAQAILLKKQRLEDRWLHVNEQQQEKERHYVKLEYKIQQAEQVSAEVTQSLQQFLRRYRLEENVPKTLLPELFMRIRGVQELAAKKKSTCTLLQSIQAEKNELLEQAQRVLKAEYSEREIFMHLRTTFLTLQQEQQVSEQSKEQLTSLQTKIQGVQSHIESYESEITQLFNAANVQSEKVYYETHEQFELQQKIKTELQTIQSQLISLDVDNEQLLIDEEQLHEKMLALEEERDALQLSIDHCIEQRATLQIQKENLLNDEKYGQLLQQFEQEKSVLQQLIGQWTAKKALATAIHETLFRLREEKLPHVLTEVNAMFNLLTGGRYDKLLINDEGYFVAQDVSGLRYQMAELSQATKEQAYISLRMALAKTLTASAPFPFIMDDPFVHFDRNRTDKMVQLMKEVGYERQILYFTCHDAMLEHWQKDQIVDVGALANERGVAST
ncbi:AAA family ATPase [Lysinibacillus sp. G4S2]|uniref:ATP-binding protein n=1 Tax=Lysinibacillus sp. G4S2 TaxID=3055859 RepID=UPI0025A15E0A|nr:AAA family ATPase [Lysinibacillus sp. G4S2]MDM5250212.1 AAA family ATPase [Lysinibacillus sp. G4S2]